MKNILLTLQTFYNTNKVTFNNIDNEKLQDIMVRATEINKLYLNKNFKNNQIERYLRIMEMIHSNYNHHRTPINMIYVTESMSEKLLLFMFSVDPNFEAAIISGSEDRTFEIKRKMKEAFGVYDINLIKVERYVIKNFLSKEKRKTIDDEIERRAFK